MPWREIGSMGFWLPGTLTPRPGQRRPKLWNWESAGREFTRGIELSPGYATGHHWYGWHLAALGRHGDAIAELDKAESLDPLSLIISADLAEELLIARRYDEAIKQSR